MRESSCSWSFDCSFDVLHVHTHRFYTNARRSSEGWRGDARRVLSSPAAPSASLYVCLCLCVGVARLLATLLPYSFFYEDFRLVFLFIIIGGKGGGARGWGKKLYCPMMNDPWCPTLLSFFMIYLSPKFQTCDMLGCFFFPFLSFSFICV